MGGMHSVIANFRPRELWYGLDSPTPEFAETGGGRAVDFGLAFRPHIAGDEFNFGACSFVC